MHDCRLNCVALGLIQQLDCIRQHCIATLSGSCWRSSKIQAAGNCLEFQQCSTKAPLQLDINKVSNCFAFKAQLSLAYDKRARAAHNLSS